MFEAGKRYEFRCIEDGSEVTFYGVVELYDHPLLKIEDSEPMHIQVVGYGSENVISEFETPPSKGRIINVTSINFIGAVERPAEVLEISEEDAAL